MMTPKDAEITKETKHPSTIIKKQYSVKKSINEQWKQDLKRLVCKDYSFMDYQKNHFTKFPTHRIFTQISYIKWISQ